jgi:hypothetical protein
MKNEKILNIVSLINEECGDGESILSLQTNGFCNQIVLDQVLLWSDEDDDRKFDETLDQYEPLEDFLVREIGKRVDHLLTVLQSFKKKR